MDARRPALGDAAGLRRILIGLDGSPDGEDAIELAMSWARATGAELVGVGIVDEPTIRQPEPVPLGATHFKAERDDVLVADARRSVERFLADFAQRCLEQGVPSTIVEDVGVPHERIVQEAERCDVVVLPRRTHFHFETEHGRDDTLRKVIRRSPRPVVTVPAALRGGHAVVAAYDGDPAAAHALHAFQTSGIGAGREVYVVAVHEDGTEAEARAARAVDYLRVHEIEAYARPMAASAAADVILEAVRLVDAGLIVMGARAGWPLTEMLFGSVTRAIVERADVAVFLHP